MMKTQVVVMGDGGEFSGKQRLKAGKTMLRTEMVARYGC